MKLRPWQEKFIIKSLKAFKSGKREFLLDAAPGSGKTLAATVLANELLKDKIIDRVIVIAPQKNVVNEWARTFKNYTGRHMGKITSAEPNIGDFIEDICCTWQSGNNLKEVFSAICKSSKVLVICDEHHHAAVEATWGESAEGAFANAKACLILTGTPFRSDGKSTIWLPENNLGKLTISDKQTYRLTYGEAVEYGYCVPAVFHRHDGNFNIKIDENETIKVSGRKKAIFPNDLKKIPGLKNTLNFMNLVRTPKIERNGLPSLNGYQASMIKYGIKKLDEIRQRMPEAGGLVIANNIEMANYMAKIIEMIEGEAPFIVHSQVANSEQKIQAFRNSSKRWIISVAMISEGVDIKRLRVLVYLPNALTELAFRQAIGRVVRTYGPKDDSRAYIIMPVLDTLEKYAKRIEREMSPHLKKQDKIKFKRCPVCKNECSLSAIKCECCGHEFPIRSDDDHKSCHKCNALNPINATSCLNCGESFETEFTVTLTDALRTGAITRGMDLTEEEVREGETIAEEFKDKILSSGDEILIKAIRPLPEESYARLKNILKDIDKAA